MKWKLFVVCIIASCLSARGQGISINPYTHDTSVYNAYTGQWIFKPYNGGSGGGNTAHSIYVVYNDSAWCYVTKTELDSAEHVIDSLISNIGGVSLPNVGTPGSYGDTLHWIAITTDSKGRVTAVQVYRGVDSTVLADTAHAIRAAIGSGALTVLDSEIYYITQGDLDSADNSIRAFVQGNYYNKTTSDGRYEAFLSYTPENVANKATSMGTLNNSLYPTTLAVSNYIAGLGYGTVTSFSASGLSGLVSTNVTNSTTTPALSFALATQAANAVWAGPTSGGATAPAFRALVAADIPSLPYIGLSALSANAPITYNSGTGAFGFSNSYSGQGSIVTVGTITSGGLGSGAVIGDATMTLGSDATGDIYYRNSSGVLTRLPLGISGQVLMSSTSTTGPAWVSIVHDSTWSNPSSLTPYSPVNTFTVIDNVRALAGTLTINNPVGNWQDGEILEITIEDAGTSETITVSGSNYDVGAQTYPTATTASHEVDLEFQYSSALGRFKFEGVGNGF